MATIRAHSAIIDAIAALLQDSSNTDYSAAELATFLIDALKELSNYSPNIVRETVTTTADSRDLDISAIKNLIEVRELEYEVGKNPRQFRNFIEHYSNFITILIDKSPAADQSVYLYCAKNHKCPDIADLLGEVDLTAGYAAGLSVIHVDGLTNSAVLEADLLFSIENDSTGTYYRLTEDTTLEDDGEGDITFTPALAEAIADGDDVTFENSTLTPTLEGLLISLTAARAAISKSSYYINRIGTGSTKAWSDTLTWGQNQLANALRELRRLKRPNTNQTYPRG
jgi:hypothetical protein